MTYSNTPAQVPCCVKSVGCLPCLNKDIFKESIPFYLKSTTKENWEFLFKIVSLPRQLKRKLKL